MNKKLLFIQLNEINFDIVKNYILNTKFKKFKNLNFIISKYKKLFTFAEDDYENLEPWIQWTSVHLGKTYKEHNIFRLGDITKCQNYIQIFEKIEKKGFKVGAVSPMNAANRLKNPAYFIPDPWTETSSDSSSFSKRLTKMLKQSVNENAKGKISFQSLLTICEVVFRTFNIKKTFFLIKIILSSFLKPWKKSLVLDYLIHLVHLYFLKKRKVDFSSVFFNAGAHIQHHYFYNIKYINNLKKNPKWYIDPKADPFEDMLVVYDQIIKDYLDLSSKQNKLIFATGLRQIPYDMTKFYYRLKNHKSFLKKLGINFLEVLPRMTRDFEIIFANSDNLTDAVEIFKKITVKKNKLKIFNEIEIRNLSLFVSLTYPNEVEKDDIILINDLELNFYNEVVFVAIKNGMHDSKGYIYISPNIEYYSNESNIHVSKINEIISNSF